MQASPRRSGCLSRACVHSDTGCFQVLLRVMHNMMIWHLLLSKAASFHLFTFYYLFVTIPHHPGGPSFESSDAQNMKVTWLFVMEDGRSGGNHRAHVHLPDTQQRETNASVKTHNTVTQTRKQYSAQHNEVRSGYELHWTGCAAGVHWALCICHSNNLIAHNALDINVLHCVKQRARHCNTLLLYTYHKQVKQYTSAHYKTLRIWKWVNCVHYQNHPSTNSYYQHKCHQPLMKDFT